MKTYKDLALVLKQQHPQYRDVDDLALARRAKELYPEKYADYIDDQLFTLFTEPTHAPTLNSSFLSIDSSTHLENREFQKKFSSILQYYQPSRGRFSSWWQSKKVEGRVHLQRLLNEEERLVIESGAMIEEAILQRRTRKAEFEMFLRRNAVTLIELNAKVELVNAALKQGLPVDGYVELRMEELRKTLGTREAAELSRIRLAERGAELDQDQNHADRIELSDRNILRKLHAELLEKRLQLRELETSSMDEGLRYNIINDLRDYITGLENEIRGRQARYHQDSNW